MTDPTGENEQLKLHPNMKLRTFAFTVFEDALDTRTRCCFCGGVLHSTQDAFERRHLIEFTENLITHTCFQHDALAPCPQVKA